MRKLGAGGLPLVARRVGELDRQTVGLSLALVVGVVLVLVLGVGPTVVGAGLLALLVVD
ncbi:MAG: hypothetical protein KC431_26665 [Myxococcales bacterium]|nr:hypothetical protein [Myxococcales bacterium]